MAIISFCFDDINELFQGSAWTYIYLNRELLLAKMGRQERLEISTTGVSGNKDFLFRHLVLICGDS